MASGKMIAAKKYRETERERRRVNRAKRFFRALASF